MRLVGRGDWFAAVTAVFAILILSLVGRWIYESGAATAVSRHVAKGNIAEYASQAQARIEHDCMQQEPTNLVACVRDIVEATNEHRRSEDDLVAQGDMALWAFWMVVVSAFSIVLTGIGVIYVRLTLSATVGAVEAAGKANALLLSDQRPWVEISMERVGLDVQDGLVVATVDILMKNVGRTPAVEVETSVKLMDGIKAQSSLQRANEFYDSVVARGTTLGEVILPNGTLDHSYRTHTSTEDRTYKDLQRSLDHIYVAVAVAYRFDGATGLTGMIYRIEKTMLPSPIVMGRDRYPVVGKASGTMYARAM